MSPNEADMIRQVLETRLDAIGKELGDTHSELHERLMEIQKQTTLTNGRVKALELAQAKTRGALAMASILVPILSGSIVALVIEVLSG
jgi:hypothetical protein